jgi:hypothetical protein
MGVSTMEFPYSHFSPFSHFGNIEIKMAKRAKKGLKRG